ncbi:hypothetical protein [Paracoccus endophyticus]|uniref:hypothetical protein n=1 Tax=Paracoccus endophyticus TaxID=2233774 RepID=UPI000DD81D01|nr:hypothetical protein [Paracoccus endophyticus]
MTTRNRDGGGPPPERLVALFALALAVLNFPLLLLWDRPVTVLGLPLLGVALFGVWAALIGLLIWVSERPAAHRRKPRRPLR